MVNRKYTQYMSAVLCYLEVINSFFCHEMCVLLFAAMSVVHINFIHLTKHDSTSMSIAHPVMTWGTR